MGKVIKILALSNKRILKEYWNTLTVEIIKKSRKFYRYPNKCSKWNEFLIFEFYEIQVKKYQF